MHKLKKKMSYEDVEKLERLFKKEVGRKPTTVELNWIIGVGYFNPFEW